MPNATFLVFVSLVHGRGQPQRKIGFIFPFSLTSVFPVDVIGKHDQVIDRPRPRRFFLGRGKELNARPGDQDLPVETVSSSTIASLKFKIKYQRLYSPTLNEYYITD
jgi:hypothetical protein